MKKLTLVFALAVITTSAYAAETEVLLKTDQTWNGGSFDYPDGEPEMTMVKVTLGANETVPFHCHAVPTIGYMLSGSIEVETKAGKKHTFNQGDAIAEVMDTIHRGSSLNDGAEILVVYAGSKGVENTHLADHSSCIATKR